MASITEEQLKDALNSVLDERDRVDRETHRDHHAWINRQIEKEARAQERWETFKKSAIGAIAVTTIGFLIKGLVFVGELVINAAHYGGAIK